MFSRARRWRAVEDRAKTARVPAIPPGAAPARTDTERHISLTRFLAVVDANTWRRSHDADFAVVPRDRHEGPGLCVGFAESPHSFPATFALTKCASEVEIQFLDHREAIELLSDRT